MYLNVLNDLRTWLCSLSLFFAKPTRTRIFPHQNQHHVRPAQRGPKQSTGRFSMTDLQGTEIASQETHVLSFAESDRHLPVLQWFLLDQLLILVTGFTNLAEFDF